MSRPRIAIIDDYQDIALACVDWSAVQAQADVETFTQAWRDEAQAAQALAPFDAIVLTRERTPITAGLLAGLPRLRFIGMTGNRTSTIDFAACSARGVVVSHTEGNPSSAAAELAFALILACARSLPQAHANAMRGAWEAGIPPGMALERRRLGLLGLGKLGAKVARYGRAFDMEVVAWSPNLTPEKAAVHGAACVDKATLFATSDVVSLHVPLSERSRGVVGGTELEAMKPGAIFINTSRGPLVDEAALIEVLRAGRIRAGLDVFDTEPLPAGHPLTTLSNVVLTPHLGFVVSETMERFYRESVDNLVAWLAGAPMRVANPDVVNRA